MEKMQSSRLTIRNDVRIPQKEAKIRGIDSSLSRVVIGGDYGALAETVYCSCPPGKSIFVKAIGEFSSLHKIASLFADSGVTVFIDEKLVEINDNKKLSVVMTEWKAEKLAIFFAVESVAKSVNKSLAALRPKWWQFSQEGDEAPYLKQLDQIDLAFFFSQTRSSLEIFGHERSVLKVISCAESKDDANTSG